MHSAIAIANYFVQAALAGKVRDLPPSKLNSLVYIAHGLHLGATAQPAINGKIMACRDGILIPELREAGCRGSRNITEPISIVTMDHQRGVMSEQTPALKPGDPVMPAVARTWKIYGQLPGYKVAEQVMEVGSPWDLIWNDEERPDDDPKVIPNTTIKLWFRSLVARGREPHRSTPADSQRAGLKLRLEQTQQLLARPDPNRLRSV